MTHGQMKQRQMLIEKSQKAKERAAQKAAEPYYTAERSRNIEEFNKSIKRYTRKGMSNRTANGFPFFMQNNIDTEEVKNPFKDMKAVQAGEQQAYVIGEGKHRFCFRIKYPFLWNTTTDIIVVNADTKESAEQLADSLTSVIFIAQLI